MWLKPKILMVLNLSFCTEIPCCTTLNRFYPSKPCMWSTYIDDNKPVWYEVLATWNFFSPHTKKYTLQRILASFTVMRNQTRNKSNSTQQKQVYILYTDLFHVKKYQQGQLSSQKNSYPLNIMIMQGEISLFLLN